MFDANMCERVYVCVCVCLNHSVHVNLYSLEKSLLSTLYVGNSTTYYKQLSFAYDVRCIGSSSSQMYG